MLLEECQNSIPTEVKTYLSERKVKKVFEAGKLADEYELLHKKSNSTGVQSNSRGSNSYTGKAWSKPNVSSSQGQAGSSSGGQGNTNQAHQKRFPERKVECFYCHAKGHVKSECRKFKEDQERSGGSSRPVALVKSVGLAKGSVDVGQLANVVGKGLSQEVDSPCVVGAGLRVASGCGRPSSGCHVVSQGDSSSDGGSVTTSSDGNECHMVSQDDSCCIADAGQRATSSGGSPDSGCHVLSQSGDSCLIVDGSLSAPFSQDVSPVVSQGCDSFCCGWWPVWHIQGC